MALYCISVCSNLVDLFFQLNDFFEACHKVNYKTERSSDTHKIKKYTYEGKRFVVGVRWWSKRGMFGFDYFIFLFGLMLVPSITTESSQFRSLKEWPNSYGFVLQDFKCFLVSGVVFSTLHCSMICSTSRERCLAFIFELESQQCYMCKDDVSIGELKFKDIAPRNSEVHLLGKF